MGITNCVNAQIVNIPDANFKSYLVGNSEINTNRNNESPGLWKSDDALLELNF